MLRIIFPYVVGFLLGVPLALFTTRLRNRPFPYRLGVGLLASVGIAITTNASLEILELVGWTTDARFNAVSKQNTPTHSTEVVKEIPANAEDQRAWEQTQHYANGTLRATRTVIRDALGEIVPHGPASTFFPNGHLKWTGNYVLGKQAGDWEEYYSDGTSEGEGKIFADGDSEEKHWYRNGEAKSAGTGRVGAKHGRWKTWYASGHLAGEFLFVNGLLHGDVREWHANGKLKLEATYSRGRLTNLSKRWNEKGELIANQAKNVTQPPVSSSQDSQ